MSIQASKLHYIYAIMSVALVLFLTGLFALFILQGRGIVESFKEKLIILVEVAPDAATVQVDSLRDRLHQSHFLKSGSLQYTSKEEGLLEMQEAYRQVMEVGLPNPLYDMFSFNVRSAWVDEDSLQRMKREVLTYPAVSDVFFQEGVVEGLAEDVQEVTWLVVLLGVLLLLVAVALIHHTVKLTLFANRFIIKNMQLVGASNGYIKRPYILRAIVHGVISGLIAVGGLWLVYQYFSSQITGLREMLSLQQLILLFLCILLLGAWINAWSTFYTVSRYLHKRIDTLY